MGAFRDRLPRGRVGDLAALAVGDRYFGLEAALRGADIVHAAEIGVPFSHGPALLRDQLAKRCAAGPLPESRWRSDTPKRCCSSITVSARAR